MIDLAMMAAGKSVIVIEPQAVMAHADRIIDLLAYIDEGVLSSVIPHGGAHLLRNSA